MVEPQLPPSFFRHRLQWLRNHAERAAEAQFKATDAEAKKKLNLEVALWQNGFIPPPQTTLEADLFQGYRRHPQAYRDGPLNFRELTSYSTWFALHPEKVLGEEVAGTSYAFPVRVKGTRKTVEQGLKAALHALEERRGHLEAMKRRRAKQQGLGDDFRTPNYTPATVGKTLSFNTVVERYNQELSKEEIQAWVWYKRSLGVPMHGWEDFFLPSVGGEAGEVLTTTAKATIFGNNFKALYEVEAGTPLGRPLNKEHAYNGDAYLMFRDGESIKMVFKSKVARQSTSIKTDPKALHALVIKGALFYNGGELVPFPVFTYGNMYLRRRELLEAKEYIIRTYGLEVYQAHDRAIKEATPPFLSVGSPDPKDRPVILAISAFAKQHRIREVKMDSGLVLDHESDLIKVFGDWLEQLDAAELDGLSAYHIHHHYVNGARVTESLDSPEEKKRKKLQAQKVGESLFTRFLHEVLTAEEQRKLDLAWNQEYNGQSNLQYQRIPIGFEVSAKFKDQALDIRHAQREGIAFMEAVGSGIIAYDVGVGKTMTAILAVANALQNGKCKRPLIVVPNPTYAKWALEILGGQQNGSYSAGVLSHTGITLNGWYNLNDGVLSRINRHRAVPENSITLVTYEGFRKIGYSTSTFQGLYEEMATTLGQYKPGNDEKKTAREKAKLFSRYKTAIGIGNKGAELAIDTMGFDYLVIDEAHRCKNVFEMVKAEDGIKRFNIEGAASQIGLKAFFLCNYIQRTYGRNVMLLTATPFTNSPLEIYSMLSLVALNAMKSQGLQSITTFFEQFVQEDSEFTLNHKEELVEKSVVKRFNNRLILQRLIHNHINYKTGEEAGVQRPCLVTLPRTAVMNKGRLERLDAKDQVVTYLRMTERQREVQNRITEEARDAKAFEKGRIFRAMSQSLGNALSPYLVEGEPQDYRDFVESSPKLDYILQCCVTVKQWHEARGETPSGQLIYLSRGKDFFPFLKEWLEKEGGYKTGLRYERKQMDEVEILVGGMAQDRKEAIIAAFNAGVVKIIIGTSTIREGIDLQKRGTAIYVGLPDWNPTDIHQLDGRMWRQGNQYAYVRRVMPLLQDSADAFIAQKLEEKTARINELWYKGDRGNVLELDSLDPAEVKMALITDVKAMAKHMQAQHIAEAEAQLNLLTKRLDSLANFEAREQELEALTQKVLDHCQKVYEKEKRVIDLYQYYNVGRGWPGKQVTGVIREEMLTKREIGQFLKTGQTTKDLLRWSKAFKYRKTEFAQWMRRWRELFVTQAQAQKNMPAPEALARTVEELNRAVKEHTDLVNQRKSFRYELKLIAEAEAKKSALAIEGKPIEERVAEFAALNYLLAFKFDPQKAGSCYLPSVDEVPGTPADAWLDEIEVERVRLQLRTRTRKRKLKLQMQNS